VAIDLDRRPRAILDRRNCGQAFEHPNNTPEYEAQAMSRFYYERPYAEKPEPKKEWFDRLTLVLIWIAGAYADILIRCKQCVHSVKMIGGMLLIVALWQWGWFTIAAHGVFSPSGFNPLLAIAALVPAVLIMLFDSQALVKPSWLAHGMKDLERNGGLKIFDSRRHHVTNMVLLAGRLGLSVVVVQIIAAVVILFIYSKDVSSELARTHQQQNATLITQATAREDAKIQKNNEARREVKGAIAKLAEESQTFREINVGGGANVPELKEQRDRLARLEQAKIEADRELSAAQEQANDELAGRCGKRGLTCKPGYGPARRAADERVANAARNAKSAADALTEAQSRLRELEGTILAENGRRSSIAEARLKEIIEAKRTEETRLAEFEAEFQRLTNGRERAIRESVEADPNFIPKDEGFLARLRALKRLAADDPWGATMILLVDLMFVGIELAGVMAKTMSFIPMEYGRTLAKNEILRAVTTAREIAFEIQRVTGTASAAPSPEALSSSEESKALPVSAGSIEPAISTSPPEEVNGANGPTATPAKRGPGRPRKIQAAA
jgi:Domain of unknown function (DUF4407)